MKTGNKYWNTVLNASDGFWQNNAGGWQPIMSTAAHSVHSYPIVSNVPYKKAAVR